MTSDSPDSMVVLDMDFSAGTGLGRGALIRVDLASGNRTLLSDDATPSGGQQFDNPGRRAVQRVREGLLRSADRLHPLRDQTAGC